MKKTTKILLITLTAFLIVGVGGISADEKDLQEQIEEKKQEVETLNKEIEKTETQIDSLQGQAKTLQGAVGQLDANIKQASLGIQSSEKNIEKLTLEIESLGYEVDEVGEQVRKKQQDVGELLRNVQRKDKNGFLESFLSSKTLAEGLAEINDLKNLQDSISGQVAELASLQEQLNQSLMASSGKKSQLQVEVKNLESRKVILDDQKQQKQTLLVQTKNQESQYQSLLTDLEIQQQSLLNEIADIESQLSKNFDRSSVPSRQPGFLIWPVRSGEAKAGVLTQHYGETAYSQYYRGRAHNGTDIGAPIGTAVVAGASGTVDHVDYNGLYYQYGRYILIDHGNGLSTLYAHLSSAVVSPGSRVEQGDLIGHVGNTGFSTGAHLHFGLYATPPGGWSRTSDRSRGGLVSIPPATGLVPIGVTLSAEQYM